MDVSLGKNKHPNTYCYHFGLRSWSTFLFYLWTILRVRPVKGIPIKMNRNKFDVNDVQLLNKFKLKGRISNMYICTYVNMYLLGCCETYTSMQCILNYFKKVDVFYFSLGHLCWRYTEIFSCLKHSKFSCVQIFSKDSFTFWTKFEFSWQVITELQLFHCCSYYENALSESQNCRYHHQCQ